MHAPESALAGSMSEAALDPMGVQPGIPEMILAVGAHKITPFISPFGSVDDVNAREFARYNLHGDQTIVGSGSGMMNLPPAFR